MKFRIKEQTQKDKDIQNGFHLCIFGLPFIVLLLTYIYPETRIILLKDNLIFLIATFLSFVTFIEPILYFIFRINKVRSYFENRIMKE